MTIERKKEEWTKVIERYREIERFWFRKQGFVKNMIGIFNLLFYTSNLMVAGNVWVDCKGRDRKSGGSTNKKDAVQYWIELEFLIFIINILAIAVFLALKYYVNWVDGIGLKF